MIMEMLIKLIKGIDIFVDFVEGVFSHVTITITPEIMASAINTTTSAANFIKDVIPQTLRIIGGTVAIVVKSGWNGTAVVNPGDLGTPVWALNNLLGTVGSLLNSAAYKMPAIIGPKEGTSGLTYVLNSTVTILANESAYDYVGSILVYVLFEFLTSMIELIAKFMHALPVILPMG